MTLKGFGMGQSTIKRKLAGAGAAQNLIDIDGKSRVTVRDLTIDGNSTDFISQFHHLIGITNSTYVTVENVRLYRMTSDGVFVSYEDGPSEHIRIRNNEFENTAYCMRNGISIVRANDVAITGNVFRHVGQNTMPGAIDVEPLSGEPTHDCSDILIEGNRFFDTATNDIQVSAGEMDIRNVVIRNNYHKNTGADGASNAKGAVYCHTPVALHRGAVGRVHRRQLFRRRAGFGRVRHQRQTRGRPQQLHHQPVHGRDLPRFELLDGRVSTLP